ncbi:hypothetical protein ACJX0J_009296, partial [Zea mays]
MFGNLTFEYNECSVLDIGLKSATYFKLGKIVTRFKNVACPDLNDFKNMIQIFGYVLWIHLKNKTNSKTANLKKIYKGIVCEKYGIYYLTGLLLSDRFFVVNFEACLDGRSRHNDLPEKHLFIELAFFREEA